MCNDDLIRVLELATLFMGLVTNADAILKLDAARRNRIRFMVDCRACSFRVSWLVCSVVGAPQLCVSSVASVRHVAYSGIGLHV